MNAHTPTLAPAAPRTVLLHGSTLALDALAPALDGEQVARRAINKLDDAANTAGDDAPAVLLLDATLAATTPDLDATLQRLPAHVVIVGTGDTAEPLAARSERVLLTTAALHGDAALRVLRAAFRHAAAALAAERAERELRRARNELRELSRIGMALMTERDPDRLLHAILEQAQRLTGSDAGSLYLVEHDGDEARLRFALANNDTLPDLPFVASTLPLDHTSLAGYAAVTGKVLTLDDAREIPETAPYSFNHSFDERFGYRTRSVLVVPMVDHKDVVVGVLQLINRKRTPDARIRDEAAAERYVLPYGEPETQLVRSLAGQAAVSIENSRLHREIENIFESFVKAAVTAIDQRDPTTAGHSVRVATLTCDLAELLASVTTGPWAGTRLSQAQLRELRYAALLHDFGKVGVREEVLVKSHKLPPRLHERVEARFELARGALETEYHQRRAESLEHGRHNESDSLDSEFRRRMEEIDRFHAAVLAANQPSILHEKSAAVLDEIARRSFRSPSGNVVPLLTEEELRFLSIPRGSLDEHERREIESHVEQTWRFLRQIPWTDDLGNVAEIAYGHHEKLDGRGYPRGLKGDQIPVQTRIMTIADIFDALTASDRPYKRALPPEKALEILHAEAREGMLDAALVELLTESRIYQKVLEKDWREL